MGVHSNVPHEFSVSLSREDVVYTFFASSVNRMRGRLLGGAEGRNSQYVCMYVWSHI